MKYIFPLAIFISSFLLFLVQPMLAKALLPQAGGSPSVWVSSMLFFQCLLLLGYGYAALGSAYLTPKKQLLSHVVLFVIAIAVAIPIALNAPDNFSERQPELWVFGALLTSIGLPYFILTSNSSLIQRWYHHSYGNSPYFLFSISNIGSMLGLLGYPLAIEWLLPLSDQMALFSIGFVALAGLIVLCSSKVFRTAYAGSGAGAGEGLGKNLSLASSLHTIFLGFIPSSLFLSVTLYVTTDIASFPLLWVIPLSLYLLTFIIAFSAYGERVTKWAQWLHPIALVTILVSTFMLGTTWLLLPHFVCFFIIAMSCHGQLARQKPQANQLTAYYFWLSLGGALGGLFNTIAPYIFHNVYEYYIVVLISLFALPSKNIGKKLDLPPLKRAIPIGAALVASIAYIWTTQAGERKGDELLFQERNFFGISKVLRNDELTYYKHGTTLHTLQPLDKSISLEPSAYYIPIMNFIRSLPPQFYERAFAVTGLGGGTTGCMGIKGQRLDFIEIDPVVIKVAKNSDLFTYVRDCPADINIFLGDGRLKLAEKSRATYNFLLMDAFTSDAIPMHLLTSQAVEMYISKLHPTQGVLAFNISNRHLDLKNVLSRIAQEHGWRAYRLFYKQDPDLKYDKSSEWMIMLPSNSPWETQLQAQGATLHTPAPHTPLWTDDYSNIWPILK